jgi:hypothetical protein
MKMRNLFLILTLFLFASCESKPFTGYIVAKEYIQGHMCHDEDHKHVVEAGYVHVPHIPHSHHHKWQSSEFILHVANKDDLRHMHVDSITYYSHRVTDKITLNIGK